MSDSHPTDFPVTDENRVRRMPKRGAYDKETVYRIVDDALICHVGMIENDRPVVIPTIHARDGDTILLHGASTSRMLKHVGAGHDICITVTHVDGLVLARSVFHHSMNYRSAVIFGKGHLIEDPDEKMKALEIFTEKLIPGRWDDARQPTANESKATHIVAVEIDMASAKVRSAHLATTTKITRSTFGQACSPCAPSLGKWMLIRCSRKGLACRSI